MTEKLSTNFFTVYKWFLLSILVLIGLGAAVRTMDAGLACPDWPLCFGDIIPDYHPQVYLEFIHRALAGVIGIFTFVMNGMILKTKGISKSTKWLCVFSFFLLMFQVILGGLTVLWLLHDKVVTAHLAMGTGYFALMCWIYWSAKYEVGPDSEALQKGVEPSAAFLVWPAFFVLLAVYVQIILGGLVASNYAALVCTDFPLCHGKFIPTLSGIIGLQVIHRLGAYVLTAVIIAYFVYVHRKVQDVESRGTAKYLLAALLIQVCVGIANVLLLTPPLVTVMHLVMGAILLVLAARALHRGMWAYALKSGCASGDADAKAGSALAFSSAR